jgi:hypothetical protein
MAPNKAYHGAGQSSVGHAAFYEAGDQRNEPQSAINERQRYKEGKEGSNAVNETDLSKSDPTKPVGFFQPSVLGSFLTCRVFRLNCMETTLPKALGSIASCRWRMSSGCARRVSRNR